jgi:GT2 family glycosyltransferase
MRNVRDSFPRVYVITLNWNGKDDTIECIESLKKLYYPNFQIVVVDNGSTDGSVLALRVEYPDITIIENKRNLGYAEGFNAGLKYAYQHGADYFLILNNDTTIDPDALAELVKVAEQNDRIGFVSGKVYSYEKPQRLQTAGRNSDPILIVGSDVGAKEVDHGQYDEVREYDFVDDVFLLVRRRVFEEVGGYDPLFFLMCEEADWCVRVRKAGFKIMYTPHAKIWHKGNLGPSSGISKIHQFYLARSEILFIRRHGDTQQFHRYLLNLLLHQAPRKVWYFLKIGKLYLLLPYLRGIGSGMVWLVRFEMSNVHR